MMRLATTTTRTTDRRRPGRVVVFVLLALGSYTGCTREFYREWANQDVSEAVYEKSRDPRYRIDLFSTDPPALARFANPYDPDRPPAPPDDFAAQSLSPVPQWPDHRLIMPIEGTGYLKVLDQGPSYTSPPPRPKVVGPPANDDDAKPLIPAPPPLDSSPFGTPPGRPTPLPAGPEPATPPAPAPGPANAPGTPGPGASRSNSGTGSGGMSPTSLAKKSSPMPPAPASRPSDSLVTPAAWALAQTAANDAGIRRVAMQINAEPMPTQTQPPSTRPPGTTPSTSPTDVLQTPRLPGDVRPVDTDLSKPDNPRAIRPDMTPGQYRESEEVASNLARMFVPEDIPMDEAVADGLAPGSRPYVLTMEKAFQLALFNARVYQYQLEQIYLNALPVTLQRFSFGPQFIAGLSPSTGIAGNGSTTPGSRLPAVLPTNSFQYTTRGSGAQTSALNIGTVAGVGKLFDNGSQILLSFANQLVFNFVGKNPLQPTVKSFLPFQAVVPFLRGGGRAVTLEGLTQAERSLLYSVRQFALFRQQFTVATLAGGTEAQFGTNVTTGGFQAGSGNADPTIGFLNVVEDVQLVENFVKNLSVFERFLIVYQELVKGESSGLTQLQVDQVSQQVQSARINLIGSQTNYRNDMDSYKIQLGMPPDVPVIIDRSRTARFKQTFEEIDRWSLSPKRELDQLGVIVARLPKLEDLVIDGRSCHEVFNQDDSRDLEDLLKTAERIALENRLDLMNARAQLYDSWRQFRVAANALKGYLNVAVTNQILTPPTTNNPFGFVSQARSFGLVVNGELPLVRVNERNNYRNIMINYERQRRTLQNTEDFIKNQLRGEIRQMQQIYVQYLVGQRNLVLSVRVKDQSFEQIIAPPQPNQQSQGAVQTNNLIGAQSSVINQENSLVTAWYNYQTQRLQVYRDLGILPYDEWEAFDEIFPPDRSQRGTEAAIGRDGRPAVARGLEPPPEIRPD